MLKEDHSKHTKDLEPENTHPVESDTLHIGPIALQSRLIVGTGKFSSADTMSKAIRASNTNLVTVALRRIDFTSQERSILHAIPPNLFLLPNTSGARTAEEAIRLARLSRRPNTLPLIKLEVTPHHGHLMPDPIDTLIAATALVKEGFLVFPYCGADPVLAKRLEEVGCVAVMPLGSPIGSNLGLLTKPFIQLIIEDASVPVIVDAGLGAPSHAAQAMEMGADAVLVNTAIASSLDPVTCAKAFSESVHAGRLGFLCGLRSPFSHAVPSSPPHSYLS